MADHQVHTYDVDTSVTRALGAAYDDVLQSLKYEGAAFLHYSLALHLTNAASAGERDPELLRERASAFVLNFPQPTAPRGLTDCVEVGHLVIQALKLESR
jgi:hypothetical protein